MEIELPLNATAVGQVVFINFLVMLFFTLKFAKGKAQNLPLVGLYTTLISFIIFPVSWLYCWYWYRRPQK